MGPLHMQPLDSERERSRRATIQHFAVDLGGPSLREVRERSTGAQWVLIAAVAAGVALWFLLQA